MSSTTKQHGLFSSRETLEEAIAYSDELIATLDKEDQVTAWTAMWVPLNTAIAKLEKVSLSNVQRQPLSLADKGFTISELSPEQASQHVRNVVVASISITKELERIFPNEGKALTILLLLVTKMFGMNEDEVIDEMAQLILERVVR